MHKNHFVYLIVLSLLTDNYILLLSSVFGLPLITPCSRFGHMLQGMVQIGRGIGLSLSRFVCNPATVDDGIDYVFELCLTVIRNTMRSSRPCRVMQRHPRGVKERVGDVRPHLPLPSTPQATIEALRKINFLC